MGYKEQLSIILMRDKGARRSFRVRRGLFYLTLLFFACLPAVCGVLAWQAWHLWQENTLLQEKNLRFEVDCKTAQATAERLEHLSVLLQEESVPGRELVLRRLADENKDVAAVAEAQDPPEGTAANGTGNGTADPGHEVFPAIDEKYVKVSNVQARVLKKSKLRLALDLSNPGSRKLATGTVEATLFTSDNQRTDLAFNPADVGDFSIHRFKRTVMLAPLPPHMDLTNAQIILEVKTQDGELVFRNLYGVEH